MKNDDINKSISTSLRFRSSRENKKRGVLRIVLLFTVAIVLVAVVSIAVMLREGGLWTEQSSTQEEISESELSAASLMTGRINFLLVCASDDRDDLRYLALLSANMNTASLSLYMLPENVTCTANSYTGTFTEHYIHGGPEQLVRAVEEYAQVGVERYMCATDSGFKNAVKLFDGLEYDVPKTVACVISGVEFTIVGGRQTLTPDMLERYMIYLSDNVGGDEAELERLLCAIVNSTVNEQNFKNGESLFKKLANYFETNISIMDYTSASSVLGAYVSDPRRTPTVAVDSLEGF